jgi:asparagine synthase (glutamine-hydrolysing)
MSAITGIYRLDGGHLDSSIVKRMINTLAHRGPDGRDTWQAGPVGLGHCMLWTTPESLYEHLPLNSEDGTLTITAYARIDNRDELISDLNLSQQRGIIPDSSLIMFAYQRWGESCVEHLLGDFAFVIWDTQKQYLFCARDHMGVRPFYYFRSDEIFAFASEIKALFCVPDIPREVNEKGLAFRLAGIDPDPSITSYSNICRLPAAHSMTVSPSETRIRRYWAPDPNRDIHFETNEEYENAFRTIFFNAVRCRMRSAFPIGMELSGGLDSSSVVCVARHLLHQENSDTNSLHTFSAVFDGVPESDERKYINYVLAGGDLTPHFIYPEHISPLSDIKHRILQNDGLLQFPTSHTFETIFQTANNSGVRVVLSGEYGDGIVSYGRRAILEFINTGKLLRAIREIVSLSKNLRVKKRTIIWYEILFPIIPEKFKHPSGYASLKWIKDSFAQRTGLVEYYVNHRKTELKQKTSREYHFFDISTYPFSLSLEEFDKIGAAHCIEPCYPFLDRRVIEFCLALPAEQRIRNGFSRVIERESLTEYLPQEIRKRTSKGNAEPYLRYTLVKFEKNNLRDILSGHPDVLKTYVDLDVIREKYQKLIDGTAVGVIPLWRTVILALWLREEKTKKDGEH